MEEQMGETTKFVKKALETCWLIICFSRGSHRGRNKPRNTVFAQAKRMERQTDGRMDGRMDGRTNKAGCSRVASTKKDTSTLPQQPDWPHLKDL